MAHKGPGTALRATGHPIDAEHAQGDKAYHQVVQQLLQGHLSGGGEASFFVVSNSMRPLMHQGDEVIVQRVRREDLRCGDVIILWDGNSYWSHRLLGGRIRGHHTVLITKGDALPYADPPVPPDRVIGRIAALQREGRRLYFHTPPHLLFHRLIAYLSRLQASAHRRTPRGQPVGGWIALFDRLVYLSLRALARLMSTGFTPAKSPDVSRET